MTEQATVMAEKAAPETSAIDVKAAKEAKTAAEKAAREATAAVEKAVREATTRAAEQIATRIEAQLRKDYDDRFSQLEERMKSMAFNPDIEKFGGKHYKQK